MRLTLAIAFGAVLLLHCVAAEENGWSWGGDSEKKETPAKPVEDQVEEQEASASDFSQESIQANSTEAEEIIDHILVSNRQGRNLDGFDEVYSDPNVQEALQKGDDGEARNIIKERLCRLGLMQCDGEDVQGKRPYIAPEELIYAQPVAINPVGRPIPTIPVKGPRGYGPPKPVHISSGPGGKYGPPNKFGPPPFKPPRRGYGPPPPPSKPFYGPPSKPFLNEHEIYEGGEFLSKPPSFIQPVEPDSPYQFEQGFSQHAHHKDKKVEVVVTAQGGSAQAIGGASSSGPQQHVHHHFHHNLEGAGKAPGLVVNTVPVATAAAVSSSQSTFGGSYVESQDSSLFKPSTSGFNPISSSSYNPSSSFGNGHSSSFGSSQGSFGGAQTFGGSHGSSLGSGSYGSGLTIGGGSSTFGGSHGSSLGSGSYGSGLTIGGGSSTFGGSQGSSLGSGSYGSGLTIGGGSGGFGGSYGGQTIANYGGSQGLGQFSSKPIDNYGPQSFGDSNSFGATAGSYGSSGLYKKELNLNSVNSNYIQSSYADKYQGLESARAENYDCVCVPYDQCPSQDVIGRKDDLYLALDPRSLKSDIEALSEDERVITDGNGTMTIVRVPKGASYNETKVEETKNEEVKKVSKREAPLDETKDDKSKVEARQSQYGTYGSNKKVTPTFGVSFGLPNQGGGGYPINPYGPNPHVNPYGGAIGGQGINLGLVSVNPLFSLQVTKDEHGDKVLKPFVNVHVTPNNFLVHKFEDLLSYKKHIIFNKHKHLHYHRPPYYPHHHEHYPHGSPEIFHGPPGPIYSGPDHHYGPDHHHGPDHHYGHGHHFGGPVEYDGPPSHHEYSDGPYLEHKPPPLSYYDNPSNYGGGFGGGYDENFYGRAYQNTTNLVEGNSLLNQFQQQYQGGQNNYGNSFQQYGNQNAFGNGFNNDQNAYGDNSQYGNNDANISPQYNNEQSNFGDLYNDQSGSGRLSQNSRGGKSLSTSSNPVKFPSSRKRRDVTETDKPKPEKRQANYAGFGRPATCGPRHVCCRRPLRPQVPNNGHRQCGTRHSQGINGRIKNPVYVDGDSEFGEYPWQVAILKKDPKESVYVCGGTLIDPLHIITAAHCVKTYTGFDLRVRLGEWDVNHDVEFFPYIERDITSVNVHPEFYAGTLYNDLAILRMDKPVDWSKHPHISPACLPSPHDDYTGTRCWTTGWGKDAFGDFGKYQNILKEVDVPIVNHGVCQRQLQQTRLGYDFKLHPGFVCAGGEEGKDACKGDGGGPMVCERGGTWQVVGVVSWGIGCGQVGVPGVYVNVAHYLDWIRQVTQRY